MDKYRFIGPVYNDLCHMYAGKAISDCRISMLNELGPEKHILFAGVGHGDDAIYAAKTGARVTVVELSHTMMQAFKRNCERAKVNERITMVESDFFKFDSKAGQFDVVVANFFLNIFDLENMKKALSHLVAQGKPGAQIIIGDFILPSKKGVVSRFFISTYWYLANILFYVLAKNPIHPVYDYPKYMSELGLHVKNIKYTKLFNINCFWSIEAIKCDK